MKSLIMGFFLLSVSLGNIITAWINAIILNSDGSSKLTGDMYYNFFALMMFITSLLFLFVVKYYKEQSYLHEEK